MGANHSEVGHHHLFPQSPPKTPARLQRRLQRPPSACTGGWSRFRSRSRTESVPALCFREHLHPFACSDTNGICSENRIRIADRRRSYDRTLADAAYDADHIRTRLEAADAIAVISNNPSRANERSFDKALYKERHLIECFFSKLKQFRRIAIRYERMACNSLAMVCVAAAVIWLH
jgi:transposase